MNSSTRIYPAATENIESALEQRLFQQALFLELERENSGLSGGDGDGGNPGRVYHD
jgi:hypothetical protein